MGVKVNIEKTISDFKEKGGKTKFLPSLKNVLTFVKNDQNINKIEHLAYLLANAKIESDYSLTRWESDYLCGEIGEPYKDKPCQKALNYYRSTDNKKDYYTLGVDSKGLPYFGRGLIQLTGKANYKKYGDEIGKNLVANGNLALEPNNSYKIASAYMTIPRGKSNKSVFEWVDEGNFKNARLLVKGSTSDWEEVKRVYDFWLPILKKESVTIDSKKETNLKKIVGIGVILVTIGITGTLIYLTLKKKNKLPNFLKKINL
jgi:predicted chitinase